MVEIRTEIQIDASPARVWGVLTDFPAYPTWNPFIKSIQGRVAQGERLAVRIQPPGGKGMAFKPTVLRAEPNRELRWLGRFLLPRIFDGEHFFELHPVGRSTRFVHGECFSGVLVPLAKSELEKGTKAGFEAMNRAIKARAEQASKP